MRFLQHLARTIATTTVALASFTSHASPVTLTLDGSVTSYENGNLSSVGLTIGLPVHLSLSFNETWSDGTYEFTDVFTPVSGSMTVGSFTYSFDAVTSRVLTGPPNNVVSVRPTFSGTGPVLGGWDFYGLLVSLTPAMQLTEDLRLGYSLDQGQSTLVAYAWITPTSYSVTRAPEENTVPTPATLPLVGLALLALGWTRRRRA